MDCVIVGKEMVLLIEGHEKKLLQGAWETFIYDYGCHISTGISG
jgi:hypothetical protein